MTFRQVRIALLLLLLALVIHNVFSDARRIARWDVPLFVVIYPTNADGSAVADRYIERLDSADFQPIAEYMAEEARRYELPLDRPVYVELADPIDDPPPQQPTAGNLLDRMVWVARLRWWRWWFDEQGRDPDILLIARYHDPARSTRLPHSTGLERIRVASAHLFANRAQRGQNHVVLVHELLHTVGAADLYDLSTGLPIFPAGYAEPDRSPLLPQARAEVMAGRIPVAPNRAIQAPSLDRTRIGPVTAAELGWID